MDGRRTGTLDGRGIHVLNTNRLIEGYPGVKRDRYLLLTKFVMNSIRDRARVFGHAKTCR